MEPRSPAGGKADVERDPLVRFLLRWPPLRDWLVQEAFATEYLVDEHEQLLLVDPLLHACLPQPGADFVGGNRRAVPLRREERNCCLHAVGGEADLHRGFPVRPDPEEDRRSFAALLKYSLRGGHNEVLAHRKALEETQVCGPVSRRADRGAEHVDPGLPAQGCGDSQHFRVLLHPRDRLDQGRGKGAQGSEGPERFRAGGRCRLDGRGLLGGKEHRAPFDLRL